MPLNPSINITTYQSIILVVSLLVSLLLTGCATNPVSGKSQLVFMSEEQEIQIGKKLSKVLPERFGGPYKDEALQSYVSALGTKLAEKSHRNNLIYHFMVLDTPIINAFALPGGYIYITRGMLAYLQSEGELAAILGHEIGHVTARHAVSQHAKSVFLAMLAAVTLETASANTNWRQVADYLNFAIVQGFGRANELQADRLGAVYNARLGYDPKKMLGVLRVLKHDQDYREKLAKEEGRPIPGYHGIFASHPDTDERLKEALEVIEEIGDDAPPPIDDNPKTYLDKINGLIYGPSEQQGVIRKNHFYHVKLDIAWTFPAGWKVENTNNYIESFTPKDEAAIILRVQDRNRKEDEAAYVERYYSKQQLKDLVPLGSELGGYTGLIRTSTRYGQRHTRVAVIYKDQYVYEILAAVKEDKNFANYDTKFLASMQSFRLLKTEEKKLAEPNRIKIVQVEPDDTIASLVAKSALDDNDARAADKIRLINGLYPDGEPVVGSFIKILN